MSVFNKEHQKKIEKIYKGLKKDDEFEFMFGNYKRDNPLSVSKYMNVLKYIASRAPNHTIEKSTQLDVVYNYDDTRLNSYRITVDGIDKINDLMEKFHYRKNHIIFTILCTRIRDQMDEGVSIINKMKDRDSTFNIDEFDVRVRTSAEKELTKKEFDSLLKISEEARHKIIFRYKQRVSLIIEDSKDASIRIDLTETKMNKNINRLSESKSIYELELEYLKRGKGSKLPTLYSEVDNLLKVLQQSDAILSAQEKEQVLSDYHLLVYQDKDQRTRGPYSMQPESVEIQHVVDAIPNRYSVTDKADGDRYFMLILNNKVYLTSTGWDIKYAGIELKGKKKEYSGTIIDGEYLFVNKYQKFLFLGFDVLFYKGQDTRDEPNLKKRLELLDDVMKNCFDVKFIPEQYQGDFDMKKILTFYGDQIEQNLEDLVGTLENAQQKTVIKRKLFIYPLGGSSSEVFAYSQLMWEKYTTDETTDCPYILDGLILTPMEQKYTAKKKEIKFKVFKWKPPELNSIDFYITFEKNPENGQIVNVFDNSDVEVDEEINVHEENTQKLENKVYRICYLHVGMSQGKVEKPILFQPENGNHIAHFFLQDGEVRDIEGNIIQDNTVIECYYNTDINVPRRQSWIPIRTRFDKTESVVKYKKKYGNASYTANRVFRSIQNEFNMEDIGILADPEKYEAHMKILKGRIDVNVIASERRENSYYQVASKLGKPQRAFHNWIKSNIIYMYCGKHNVPGKNKKKMDILDVGCGRGGDFLKFFHSRVNSLVGIDPVNENINSTFDGAYSRYLSNKNKYPSFPPMTFLVANAGALFNLEEQQKIYPSMDEKNKKGLIKFFGQTDETRSEKKFDVFNCQFMLHYLFESDTVWNNFCQNVNRYLSNDGYVLVTTFDGELVDKQFDKDGKISSYYTDQEGKKNLFFEVVKKYNKVSKLGQTGIPIDVHIRSFMNEGTYITEFLVEKDYLIKEFREKCGLRLVETDLFENVYQLNKGFFDNAASTTEDKRTRKFLMDAKTFYDEESNINKASYTMSFLYRYYVFKRDPSFKIPKNPRGGANGSKGSVKPKRKRTVKK